MRKVVLAVVVLLALFVLGGCKAGRLTVQDNVYDALGGQVIKVDDSFEYIGETDPAVMISVNRGKLKRNSKVKIRGDVFVNNVDGRVTELVVLQRLKITQSRANWVARGGESTAFGGSNFKERNFYAREGENVTVDGYINFIIENGYKFDDTVFFVRELSRNQGMHLNVSVFYAIARNAIPAGVGSDEIHDFLRDKFEGSLKEVH